MLAAVAYGAVRPRGTYVSQGVIEGMSKLRYYGYRVVVEVDEQVQMTRVITELDSVGIPFDSVVMRGDEVPDVVIDSRHSDWRGWRIAMSDVDERHRPLYYAYCANKTKTSCPVVTIPLDDSGEYHPLEDCKS